MICDLWVALIWKFKATICPHFNRTRKSAMRDSVDVCTYICDSTETKRNNTRETKNTGGSIKQRAVTFPKKPHVSVVFKRKRQAKCKLTKFRVTVRLSRNFNLCKISHLIYDNFQRTLLKLRNYLRRNISFFAWWRKKEY